MLLPEQAKNNTKEQSLLNKLWDSKVYLKKKKTTNPTPQTPACHSTEENQYGKCLYCPAAWPMQVLPAQTLCHPTTNGQISQPPANPELA